MASTIADSRKFWQEKEETTPRKSLTVPGKGSHTMGLRSVENPSPSSDASRFVGSALSPRKREDHKQSLDKLFAQFQQKHKQDKSANDAAQAALSDRRREMEAVIESLKHKQAEEALLEATAEARVMEAESKAELATVKASQMVSQLYVHAAIESDAAALDALAQARGAVVAIEDKKDRVPDLIAKLVEAELPDDSKSAVAGALGRRPAIADVVKRLINSQIQDAVAEATLRQNAAEAKLEATLRQVAGEAKPQLGRPWTMGEAALAVSGLASVGGGAIGSIFGAAAGAACGIPFAPFTLGLSIPVGAASVASVGMAVGSTTGAVAGCTGGYVAGLAAFKLESWRACKAKTGGGKKIKAILDEDHQSDLLRGG